MNPPVRHTHKRNSISCCERSTNASPNRNTSSENNFTCSNTHLEPCPTCGDTYHPVGIIYSIHVNFCYKSNSRGCIWVPGATLHFQAVYPVLIVGLKRKQKKRAISIKNMGRNVDGDATCIVCIAHSCWSNDHACPPCQSHVLVILKAPADCAITFTLLPLFELFQQTKIAWNFNWKREERLRPFKYLSEHSRFGLQIPKRMHSTEWVLISRQKEKLPANGPFSSL